MELREDINRIKEVMGINESKMYSSIESLINKTLVRLRELCDNDDYYADRDLLTICDLLDSDLQFKVISVNRNQQTNKLEISLYITYRNITNIFVDFLLYEIRSDIKKTLGVDCEVEADDVINLYYLNDPQW